LPHSRPQKSRYRPTIIRRPFLTAHIVGRSANFVPRCDAVATNGRSFSGMVTAKVGRTCTHGGAEALPDVEKFRSYSGRKSHKSTLEQNSKTEDCRKNRLPRQFCVLISCNSQDLETAGAEVVSKLLIGTLNTGPNSYNSVAIAMVSPANAAVK
jgi:hypothetical protein